MITYVYGIWENTGPYCSDGLYELAKDSFIHWATVPSHSVSYWIVTDMEPGEHLGLPLLVV